MTSGESAAPLSFLIDFATVKAAGKIVGHSAAANLFDGSKNTQFCAKTDKKGAASVLFCLCHSETVTGYTLTVSNSVALRPDSWELNASDQKLRDAGGRQWVLIASSEGLPKQANAEASFPVDLPGEYLSFRLVLKTTAASVSLGGLALK